MYREQEILPEECAKLVLIQILSKRMRVGGPKCGSDPQDEGHLACLASSPGSFYYAKINVKGRESGLDGFDHVRTLMMRTVSTVSTHASPKEREKSLE